MSPPYSSLVSSYQYHFVHLGLCSVFLWKCIPGLLSGAVAPVQSILRGIGCLCLGLVVKSELQYMWIRKSLPPGDSGILPLIGDTLTIFRHPTEFYIRKIKEYGNLFLSRNIIFGATIFFTSDKDVAWFVTQERKGNIKPYMPDHVRRLMGENCIIISYGDFHRRLRRLIEPALLPTAIQSYIPIMDRCICTTLEEKWGKSRRNLQSSECYDLALQLLLDCVFPQVGRELAEDIRTNCQLWLRGMGSLVPIRMMSKTYDDGCKARERLDRILTNLIQSFQRDHPNDQSTLLGRLCYSKDVNGKQLTAAELMDNILLLFVAGHDTFAGTLGSMLYHLSELPQSHRDALQMEIEGLQPDYEQLKSAPILNAFLAENWRLVSPAGGHAGTVRIPLDFVTSSGTYHIPKGVALMVKLLGSVNDGDDSQIVNPLQFYLGRYLPPDHPLQDCTKFATGIDYNSLGLKYRSFGVGAHTCLGHHFAKIEARLFLTRLLQSFDVKIHKSQFATMPLQRWDIEFELIPKKNKEKAQ